MHSLPALCSALSDIAGPPLLLLLQQPRRTQKPLQYPPSKLRTGSSSEDLGGHASIHAALQCSPTPAGEERETEHKLQLLSELLLADKGPVKLVGSQMQCSNWEQVVPLGV